jgi:peptidoglycan/LPS O-acetylase OafA/YrhL
MGEGDRTFGYVGALDGLRAFAVAVVLVFHAELGGAEGGFLGVSVFFTLSGFLITSLLVAEHERTGTVDLGA